MVKRRSQAGYSLLEVAISMAVFVAIIAILAILTAELSAHQKRAPMNFMKNPQIVNVLSRMRRDVMDAHGPQPYENTHDGYTMNEKTLIIRTITQTGGVETVVWDFGTPGIVKRRSYNVGVATEWVARGVPPSFNVELDAVDIEGRPWGVLVRGRDEEGRIAIEQILQPRAHN